MLKQNVSNKSSSKCLITEFKINRVAYSKLKLINISKYKRYTYTFKSVNSWKQKLYAEVQQFYLIKSSCKSIANNINNVSDNLLFWGSKAKFFVVEFPCAGLFMHT
jgi:hypothetical protein